MKDHTRYWHQPQLDHRAAADAIVANCLPSFESTLRIWTEAIQKGGKLIFFGNGGSAAMAQHFAAECVVRLKKDRKPIPAIDLTAGAAILTATVNDIHADQIFARHLQAIAKPCDVAVGLTTSGRSPNIIHAIQAADKLGLDTTCFCGNTVGDLPPHSASIIVASTDTARIQEMHLMIGHMLIGALEAELNYV